MSQSVLVSYDVIDDARLRKIYKALTRLGRHLQYSVFLIQGRSPDIIQTALRPLLNSSEDNIRIHPLCASCLAKAILMGRARSEANLPPPGFRIV